MGKFLSLALSGAVTGAIFSLVAAGLVVSYSATGIFNFSYGAVAFASAFLFYQLHSGLHWPIVPAAITVIAVFAPLLGLVLDVGVFRPLARATESAKIMATVGMLIAIPALVTWLNNQLVNTAGFGIPRSSDVTQVGLPLGIGPTPRAEWRLPFRISFNSNELVVLISAVVVAVALWLFLRHTPLGLQMRAVVDRADLAGIRGINERSTSRYAWVIGMMLAALAGVAGAPVIGTLDPNGFIAITFVAAAAAVIGGLRSIPLAFVGGIGLGAAQNLVFGYGTNVRAIKEIRGFNSAVPFVLLLVGLVLITRDRGRRGGSVAEERPPPDYTADLPPWRRALPWAIAVVFLIVYVLVLANSFWVSVMATGLTLGLIFLSFVVITGLGGMVSLAQGTFVLAASLTTGMLIARYDWSLLPAMVVAVAATVVLSTIVALPALRLGGLPLALATLALAFLGDQVLFQWNWLHDRQAGWAIPRPVIGPFNTNNNKTFTIFVLLLVGIVAAMIHNLRRSSWGRAIAATRSSELAANTSGVSVLRVKLGIFALSAAIAGVGGVMYASNQRSITNLSVTVTTELLWLASVVLFGVRRPAAVILAGVVSAMGPVIFGSGFHLPGLFPSWLGWNGTTSTEIPAILFGLNAVQLSRNPDGVISITSMQNHARRVQRKARRGAGFDSIGRPGGEVVAAATGNRHATQVVPVDAALEVRGVRAGYDAVEVLHGIDLIVRPGQISVLLGANGGGKTTLCSTISGLIPVRGGSIWLHERDVTTQTAYQRARSGVLVAPESRGVFPGLSVEENLMLRLAKASERDEVYQRFEVLKTRRHLPAGSLSGGEQQMLTLAPVLVNPPQVVVADEPTLGLAPLVVIEVMKVFEELRDLGTAILLVEEKSKNVLEIAEQVAFMELGHIIWSGPRNSIDDEHLLATYLGSAAR